MRFSAVSTQTRCTSVGYNMSHTDVHWEAEKTESWTERGEMKGQKRKKGTKGEWTGTGKLLSLYVEILGTPLTG